MVEEVIAVGYLVGRTGVLGEQARYVLNRVTFFVASPALLHSLVGPGLGGVLGEAVREHLRLLAAGVGGRGRVLRLPVDRLACHGGDDDPAGGPRRSPAGRCSRAGRGAGAHCRSW